MRLASGNWGGDPQARILDAAWRAQHPDVSADGVPATGNTAAPASTTRVVLGASEGTKVCPRCAEEVRLAAQACRYCQYDFTGAGAATSQLSRSDAQELAARRAQDERIRAKYHGWKPLVIWYVFWATLIGIGGIASLAAANIGGFFISAILCGLALKYAHYLYHGGRRRVWFVIW